MVVIQNGRIAEVGRRVPAGVEEQDLGDVAVLPGLVNSHCHLEFSSRKTRLGKPGVPLHQWIRQVIGQRQTAAKIGKAVAQGLADSVAAGVTTLADICRVVTPSYTSAGVAPRLVLLQEAIGYSQARAASATAAVEQNLSELSDLAADADPARITLGVSPHAPYTASPALVRELVSVAVERGAAVALHLAESEEELELINAGSGPFQQLLEERGMWDPWAIQRGASPMDYLRILTKAPRALVVHGNYLDDASLAMMARHAGAMSLVYCPRTHAYFQHPDYPLAKALAMGVRVCLGTDGLASNPDLSLLEEMREVSRRHPRVSPEAVLRMGTLSGAEALGLERVAGCIRPGMPADLVTAPISAGAGGGAQGLLESILADNQPISSVWMEGAEATPAKA
ncbi:MAG: amidohydrolase family protein [Planctomycetota bacterium]